MSARSASAAAKTTAPAAALGLDSQLCFALYSSSLAMTKLYKPLLERLGLTYPQYLVMLVLWECDGVAVGEIGARLFLDSGTLTPLLKRLEGAGLIRRIRAADDERRVLVHLSAEGRGLRTQARLIPRALAGTTGCSAATLSTLTRQLLGLRTQLHAAA